MDRFDIGLGILFIVILIPVLFVTGCVAMILAQYTTVLVVAIILSPELSLAHVLNMPFSEVWSVTTEFWFIYVGFLFLYWLLIVSWAKSKD